jgi:hypothetical protein
VERRAKKAFATLVRFTASTCSRMVFLAAGKFS